MSQYDTAVTEIQAALNTGDLPTARKVFRDNYVEGDPADKNLVDALAKATPIPEDTVVWGHGIDLWSNPYRDDYVARCGVRSGGCSNRAWVLYKTPRGAQKAAERHAEEHRAKGEPVPIVAEWGTV
jgi:hypothetical protein